MPREVDPLAGHHKFDKIKDLGQGAFGIVYLAENRYTGEQVAIKFLPRGRDHVTKHVEREILSQSSFCHPHIILFREVFLTPTHLGIVLEYAAGGDLFQYVCNKGAVEEPEARRMFQQVILALDYCHQMGVYNRDIKLENTLLDRNKRLLKITDFGYAKTQQDSLPITNVGTPNYAAPEVISQTGRRYDGKPADIWSCGVMLYVMLFHSYPFERPGDPPGRKGLAMVFQRTQKADYKIPSEPRVSQSCVEFLNGLLRLKPSERLTIREIYQHPWFKHGFPADAPKLTADCLAMRSSQEEVEAMQNDIKLIVREARYLPGDSEYGRLLFDENVDVDAAIDAASMSYV